jgi:hypothetical protein
LRNARRACAPEEPGRKSLPAAPGPAAASSDFDGHGRVGRQLVLAEGAEDGLGAHEDHLGPADELARGADRVLKLVASHRPPRSAACRAVPAARLAAERLRVIVYEIINLMKNLIIVGGTMGVGKTATCRELQKILPRNVFLDGDWCWDMHPFVVTGETKAMVNSNIAHLLNGFLACSEFENVIFCWVLHE